MTTNQWVEVTDPTQFKMKVAISFFEDMPVHTHSTHLGKIHLCKGIDTHWFDVDESDEHRPEYTIRDYKMPTVTSLCGILRNRQISTCDKQHPEGWEDNLCQLCRVRRDALDQSANPEAES